MCVNAQLSYIHTRTALIVGPTLTIVVIPNACATIHIRTYNHIHHTHIRSHAHSDIRLHKRSHSLVLIRIRISSHIRLLAIYTCTHFFMYLCVHWPEFSADRMKVDQVPNCAKATTEKPNTATWHEKIRKPFMYFGRLPGNFWNFSRDYTHAVNVSSQQIASTTRSNLLRPNPVIATEHLQFLVRHFERLDFRLTTAGGTAKGIYIKTQPVLVC